MIHSLFVMNDAGDVTIEKHYRGFMSRSVCHSFWSMVQAEDSPAEMPPVARFERYFLIHIQSNRLFLLAVVEAESPPLMVVDFLYQVESLIEDYFGEVSEAVLKKNFVTVYQLLDEMMDGGQPFMTEPSVLKEIIPPPSMFGGIVGSMLGPKSTVAELPTLGSDSSGARVPWRKNGIKHSTNEIYLDITEEVDAIMDAQGMTVSCEVSGDVQCTCALSGMPDMTLSFRNSRVLDDCSFHACVRYKRWEMERVVSFVPPEGKFGLMSYRVTQGVTLPIYVRPQIHFNQDGGSVSVMVGSRDVSDKTVEKVTITIPFSKSMGASKVDLVANHGKTRYDDASKVFRWEIGNLPKDKSPHLEGKIHLAGVPPPDANPTIIVDFSIQMWGASGVSVESLNLRGESYKPYKGVRTITQAGRFQIRA